MSRKPREFLRFVVVGAGGFGVDLAFFLALLMAGTDPYLARAVSASFAITTTWWLNKEWTFRAGAHQYTIRTYPAYILVQSGGLAVNFVVFAATRTLLTGGLLHSLLALSLGAGAALLFNFIGARGIVFRGQC